MGLLLSHQVWVMITLFLILLYASMMDIRTREVGDFVAIMIIVLAVGGLADGEITKCLIGAAMVGMPLLIMAISTKGMAIGGADVKLAFAVGFLLGVEKGLIAIITGLLLGVICQLMICIIKKESFDKSFPLIPYLSAGTMLLYLI